MSEQMKALVGMLINLNIQFRLKYSTASESWYLTSRLLNTSSDSWYWFLWDMDCEYHYHYFDHNPVREINYVNRLISDNQSAINFITNCETKFIKL